MIGTLTARADGPVEIVTGDRDLFQLVDDERPARVLYTQRGLTKLDVVDESAVTARYHIPGRATRTTRCCVATPAMACPVFPGVGRRPRPPWCGRSARSRRCWRRSTRDTAGFP